MAETSGKKKAIYGNVENNAPVDPYIVNRKH